MSSAIQPQRLSLTTTSLSNVVISNSTDVIYYEVVTPAWEPTVTRVSKMDPRTRELEVVAEMQNEVEGENGATAAKPKPKTVRLRGEQFRPTGEFWVKGDGEGAKFRGKDGKHYEWRTRKGKLELVLANDPEQKPVVRYHKHRRYFMVLRLSKQPYLEVQPAVMETLDSLIVSFLLMERKRRDGKGKA